MPRTKIFFPTIKATIFAKLSQTQSQKLLGLMFEKVVEVPILFIFNKNARFRNSIHSLFCPRFDAAFISKDKKIVSYFKDIGPNNPIIIPGGKCVYLIEAPPNSLEGLKPGDPVEFTLYPLWL